MTADVSWPSGKKETYKDLAADFIYTIVEDKGITGKTPFSGQSSATKADAAEKEFSVKK
jgi:hypothetical protein